MLALAVSFLVAAYMLGPGLLVRMLLGFVVPRKNVVQTRGEEFTRSIEQAALPLAISIVWAAFSGSLRRAGSWADVGTVLSGLYSTAFFDAHREAFFGAMRAFGWMNLAILWRLYLLIFLFALAFDQAILHYRWLRERLPAKWPKWVLATLVLPRVSEWHVLLSDMLLPAKGFSLDADVLTKSGVLYQGRVQDKMLGSDGGLQSITLAHPRRFLREEFGAAKDKEAARAEKAGEKPEKIEGETFWRSIPGNLFVIMATDVINVNLRYIRENPILDKPTDQEVLVLRGLLERLTQLQKT